MRNKLADAMSYLMEDVARAGIIPAELYTMLERCNMDEHTLRELQAIRNETMKLTSRIHKLESIWESEIAPTAPEWFKDGWWVIDDGFLLKKVCGHNYDGCYAPATPDEIAEFYTITGRNGERARFYWDAGMVIEVVFEDEMQFIFPKDSEGRWAALTNAILDYFGLDVDSPLIMPYEQSKGEFVPPKKEVE